MLAVTFFFLSLSQFSFFAANDGRRTFCQHERSVPDAQQYADARNDDEAGESGWPFYILLVL